MHSELSGSLSSTKPRKTFYLFIAILAPPKHPSAITLKQHITRGLPKYVKQGAAVTSIFTVLNSVILAKTNFLNMQGPNGSKLGLKIAFGLSHNASRWIRPFCWRQRQFFFDEFTLPSRKGFEPYYVDSVRRILRFRTCTGTHVCSTTHIILRKFFAPEV